MKRREKRIAQSDGQGIFVEYEGSNYRPADSDDTAWRKGDQVTIRHDGEYPYQGFVFVGSEEWPQAGESKRRTRPTKKVESKQ